MRNEYQRVLWVVLGLIIILIMASCSYSINVVHSEGLSNDVIDSEPKPEFQINYKPVEKPEWI